MKIVLVQFHTDSEGGLPPLGILSLANYIKKHGHEPKIQTIKRHPNFYKAAAKQILSSNPKIIGFSVMCNTLPSCLIVARECKKLSKNVPIVFGGPDVTFEDYLLLKLFNQIDIIVRGEGEITFLELVNAIKTRTPFNNILGITYKKTYKIKRNPDRPFIKDLDVLPPIDYSLLPNIKEFEAAQIEGGRGCPHQCTYCSTCKMWKRNFRIKSPKRLAKELEDAYLCFRPHTSAQVAIVHDHLLANRKWTDRFLPLLYNKKIPWACDARYNTLDQNLIKKLKKAGCNSVFIGVESGSARMQRLIKKHLDLSNFYNILGCFSKNNIHCILSFMIGFPQEKKADLNQTLQMALKAKLFHPVSIVQINGLSVLKGTEIFNKIKNRLDPNKIESPEIKLLSRAIRNKNDRKKIGLLFPSYCHAKTNDFPPLFLKKTSILFTFLCDFFPATTLLLLNLFNQTPYQLGKLIISFLDDEKITWGPILNPKTTLTHHLKYFDKFIKTTYGSNKILEKIFSYERLSQTSRFDTRKSVASYSKMKFSSRPKILKGIKIKRFSCDPAITIEDLKHDRINIKRSPSFYVFIPGNIFAPIPLSKPLYKLLSTCTGKNTVRNILFTLSDRKNTLGNLSKTLELLRKNKIIGI
ncbi:MAG: B12-binding domain-containing radical SAM protein [Candidatus Saganbacteria bacterium]|nr:B12-binding domain-containing radical SAM protein [Candidatus Saganbacteria bacterium]